MIIYYKNKPIGNLRDNDRVFITQRKEIHVFRKFNGFGLTTDIIMQLRRLNCRKIVFLYEKANGEVEKWETTTDRMLELGVIYKDGYNDFQRILPFEYLNQTTLQQVIP